jgi:hypothetical protein
MFVALPLMIIPLALYNLALIGIMGGSGVAGLGDVVISLQMLSGADWTMTLGDVLIVIALGMLFIEILKASRYGRGSLLNHMLSMLVFIGFLVEFLLVRNAATQIFFILMTITLVDVVGGFAVAIRAAGRDVSIGL